MENFLSKADYDFSHSEIAMVYRTKKYILFTNKDIYKKTPPAEVRQDITQIILLKEHKLANYPSLKYLEYMSNITIDIDFSKIKNLKVLSLHHADAKHESLLNLPNLETLVFGGLYWSQLYNEFTSYNFAFSNLPCTLNNIIFMNITIIQDTKADQDIINFLKQKIALCKIPFGCKVYFINCNSKVYDIGT